MKFSKKLALFLLMLNMFLTFSGVGLVIPIMPTYLKTFGAAGQALGFIIALMSFAQFIFSPVAGNLSDRHGRKNLIIFGLVVNGLSQIAMGLSTELWMLYLCRFFTGVGSAFIIPPVMAYVADITTKGERGKAMGWIGAAISLGFMIGPGIGGFLSNVSLHFPFYFAGGATHRSRYHVILHPSNCQTCGTSDWLLKGTTYSNKWPAPLKQAILYYYSLCLYFLLELPISNQH